MPILKIFHSPLVQFFVLGAGMFLLFDVVGGDAHTAADEVVVDSNRVAALMTRFERTWQRPPSRAELDRLIDGWVREEIFYREGLAMSLDRDDPVVRRRVAQKLEFISDVAVTEPGEQDLTEWLADHNEDYRVPSQYAFEHVLFTAELHGDMVPTVAVAALRSLRSGSALEGGDPTLLPGTVDVSTVPQITRTFGEEFVAALAGLPIGEWAGPVRSGYGLHIVRVSRAIPDYLPNLDEVRAAVERDWLKAESEKAKQSLYSALRQRYSVRIDSAPALANLATGQ